MVEQKVRVALTYIVKDDSDYDNFKQSLTSFMPYFDGLYVAVTGTSGEHSKIHELVKEFNGVSISTNPETHPEIYHKFDGEKWEFARFNKARNVVFDIVPDDYDYVSWADTDDILFGGNEIKELLKDAHNRNVNSIFCTYLYQVEFNENGIDKIILKHLRERFVKKNDFTWKMNVHEVLIPSGGYNSIYKPYKPEEGLHLAWVHTMKNAQSNTAIQRNIKLLELQAKEEEEKDPRTLLYLGKTYYDLGPDYFDKALHYLNKYIPMSGWDEEIGTAYWYIGVIYFRSNNILGALSNYLLSYKHNPINQDLILRIAECYLYLNKFEYFKHFINIYEQMKPKDATALIESPANLDYLYYTLKWEEAYKTGKLDQCIEYARKRQKYKKDSLLDDTIQQKEKETIAQGYLNMATYLIKNNRYRDLIQYIHMCPQEIEHEEFVKKIISFLPGRKHDDKSIVYFASFYQPHFEKWNGNNLKSGIGGSESAVIYLSEQWAKIGYHVTVYCDTPENVVINGVAYIKYWQVNWNDLFNVFIMWRTPHFADANIKTRKLFVDLHDICNPSEWTEDRMKKIDKVFFKSKWHSEQIPQLDVKKRVIISNGITL